MPHEKYLTCIEACQECAVACNHCASSCLQEEDVNMMARCIALDLDCADLCHLAVRLMSRGSEEAGHICQHCAEVCRRCAEECRRHDVEHCQQCAEACERCAEECERMAGESDGTVAEPRSQRQAGRIQKAGARAASTMTTDRSVRPLGSSLRRRQTIKS